MKYYFFELEIALRKEDDLNIYAYENVSHIPTRKLIEIFNINLDKDPDLVEGYVLTKSIFKKHKKYIEQNIGQLNLDVFEYCLRQYVSDDFKSVRKLYKEDLME
ncbi:MAG: hypothetical protein SFU20_09475 [Chitinophagaceae bacterium]|nr:hypothetical protein [Chitinophagaceae bacterium]